MIKAAVGQGVGENISRFFHRCGNHQSINRTRCIAGDR
ncbi:hypothetical protein B6N60_01577 [Richelia sinica FACHB-800]|uniref:Uncharacterized protein n=1 Tax=Richelia sinica FACHB-800 TaxID=1357546 RepID=A0A975Y474_9NOST|nr:hypothetical protein B6N60_01577 [Richelia sinica FACHB-800]